MKYLARIRPWHLVVLLFGLFVFWPVLAHAQGNDTSSTGADVTSVNGLVNLVVKLAVGYAISWVGTKLGSLFHHSAAVKQVLTATQKYGLEQTLIADAVKAIEQEVDRSTAVRHALDAAQKAGLDTGAIQRIQEAIAARVAAAAKRQPPVPPPLKAA